MKQLLFAYFQLVYDLSVLTIDKYIELFELFFAKNSFISCLMVNFAQ